MLRLTNGCQATNEPASKTQQRLCLHAKPHHSKCVGNAALSKWFAMESYSDHCKRCCKRAIHAFPEVLTQQIHQDLRCYGVLQTRRPAALHRKQPRMRIAMLPANVLKPASVHRVRESMHSCLSRCSSMDLYSRLSMLRGHSRLSCLRSCRSISTHSRLSMLSMHQKQAACQLFSKQEG